MPDNDINFLRKDFSAWHSLKSKIENFAKLHFFHEREVWWCSLGSNIGVEEDGKNSLFERPVVIIKKFSKELFWALPLTTSTKDGQYYFPFSLHGKECKVILSQLRSLSSKRLIRRVGKIGKKRFREIGDKIYPQPELYKNGSLAGASSA